MLKDTDNKRFKDFALPPPYSPQLLISIQRTITTQRLSRYLGATLNDVPKALELYEYNVQLSEFSTGFCMGWKWPCGTPSITP